MTPNLAMNAIYNQLRAAQDKQYVVDLTDAIETITAVFSSHIQQTTVDAVVGHIIRQYGTYVAVIPDATNKRHIEIINKDHFSLGVT